MQEILQNLLNGIPVGAIYALIALGYTMVYGILKLINFAHGDVFMLGSFVGFYAGGYAARHLPTTGGALGWGYAGLVMLIAMVVCGLFGFLNERIAYRPLRGAPRIASLITAIGVSFLLEYGGQYLFGPNPRGFGILKRDVPPFAWHGVSIGYVEVVIILVSLSLMLVLQRIVFHTRIGTAMRAVSWNPAVAGLMGV